MSEGAQRAPFEPFYLPAPHGDRFCIFHPAHGVSQGAILYLHPFAEEMNKSRRMAALQARALAAKGFAVLQIDLFGCGDSSGEIGEARWEIWREDALLGIRWLRQRVSAPVALWGMRLGAALALDVAASSREQVTSFLLWQPVVNGDAFVMQFLRLQVATGMLQEGAAKVTTQALRQQLYGGARLEVAGYDLAPELMRAIAHLNLAELAPCDVPVYWLEVTPDAGRGVSPASQRIVDAWLARGTKLDVRAVTGQPFWNTVEITECHELIAETTRVVLQEAG